MHLRRAVLPLVLAAAGAGAAPAPAAAPGSSARLRVTAVVVPATAAGAGTVLHARGALANTGGRAARATLVFTLRSEGRPHTMVALGRRTTGPVASKGRRAFSAALTVRAAALPARVTSRYRLVVCVGQSATRCRAARTTLRLRPRPAGTLPGAAGTPATGAATTPATPATPTTGTGTPGPATRPDGTAPTTTDDVPAVYRNTPVRVTLTAADEAGGSGVDRTFYEVGSDPAVPTAASAVYDPTAKPTLTGGQVIRYRSVDRAGNLEAPRRSAPALVDTTAPTTVDDVTTARSSARVTVSLTASDTGGAGVERTYYTVGASPPAPTTGSSVYDPSAKPTLGDGERIRYFSVDFAGNAEASHLSAVATVDPTVYTPGARSAGDSLFPDIGAGGYDALHYALDLDYDIASKALRGTTTVTLKATQNLSRLTLDLAPWLRVSAVTVDGAPATFRQGAAAPANGTGYDYDLDITPAAPGLKVGSTHEVAITYGGITKPVKDPDGADDGWIPDATYGAIAVSEPIGAMGWFPCNNVPHDKATYTIKMAVPEVSPPWVVVGTGVLTGTTVAGGRRTYTWDDTVPTASYLASVSIAKFDFATGTSTVPAPPTNPLTVPFYTAVDRSFDAGAKTAQLADLNRTPAILDYYADYYGVPYAFNAMGGINPRQSVGYSLETQGKPTYAVDDSASSTGAGITTVAHENAHMYFGDDVTLTEWKDIWLNEGMTEFSAWLWSANKNGGTPLPLQFARVYSSTASADNPPGLFWAVAPANPKADEIFDYSAMYERGAATIEAIREILGDATFRTVMHDWLTGAGHPYGNATTEQFVALVKSKDPVRAARWDQFFQEWLYTSYTTGRPTITPTTF